MAQTNEKFRASAFPWTENSAVSIRELVSLWGEMVDETTINNVLAKEGRMNVRCNAECVTGLKSLLKELVELALPSAEGDGKYLEQELRMRLFKGISYHRAPTPQSNCIGLLKEEGVPVYSRYSVLQRNEHVPAAVILLAPESPSSEAKEVALFATDIIMDPFSVEHRGLLEQALNSTGTKLTKHCLTLRSWSWWCSWWWLWSWSWSWLWSWAWSWAWSWSRCSY
jgi:hypothetical protein